MMRLTAAMLLAWLVVPVVHGADGQDKGPTPQQMRMKQCNERAGDMKGEERKQFMSACLSGKDADARMTPQERMKHCNQRAGEMKGEERKQFMSQCLKG